MLLNTRSGARRAVAVRDTQVISLSASVIRAAAVGHPQLLLALGRRLARRARGPAPAAGLPAGMPAPARDVRTVCLLPLSSGKDLSRALDYMCGALHRALLTDCYFTVNSLLIRCGALHRALQLMRVRTLLLSSGSLHEELDIALATFAPFGEIELSLHLAALESRHQLLLCRADPFPSDWTRRCLRNADLVLLVGLATDVDVDAAAAPAHGATTSSSSLDGGGGGGGGGGVLREVLRAMRGGGGGGGGGPPPHAAAFQEPSRSLLGAF